MIEDIINTMVYVTALLLLASSEKIQITKIYHCKTFWWQ